MTRLALAVVVVVSGISLSPIPAEAQGRESTGGRQPLDPDTIARLEADTGGTARVSIHPATGTVRFVRLRPGSRPGLTQRAGPAALARDRHDESMEFLRKYAGAFGLAGDPSSVLRAEGETANLHGGTHLIYSQIYRGVPAFAGTLKTHFDAAGNLTAISGMLIPNIALDPDPSVGREAAAVVALAVVSESETAATNDLGVRNTRLYVYRTGLAQGVEGQNHLAWEVEVGNAGGVREFVYVDAHTGKPVDRITGVHDVKARTVYQNFGNFPANPFWSEGDPFPTASAEANNVITGSGETYDLFFQAFGRDSWDGAGGTMHGIFDATSPGLCPNAFWNGLFTAFCAGVSPDDIVAHEWGHAYTERTHNLIYQWQPGALNEAYSDIWGEVVDFINGRGSDSPGGPRTAGACTVFTTLPGVVTINAPPAIAGDKASGFAFFGPQSFNVTSDVVLVNDGVGSSTDGCETPFVNAVAGRIALIDRGTCAFTLKVKNAQLNGAVGVIIANNVAGIVNMGGADPTITIPALSVSLADGNAIKAQLVSTTVNARLRRGGTGTDNSYRWLAGEDAPAFGGAIRDLWDPTCYGDPGRVSDTARYACGTGDNGGVHTNSGVANHGFALIVDGGTYNGHTVAGLGLTKAAHIYFRAQTVYQHRASDFADHADALEQSCADLVEVELTDLATGAPSGQVITASDCDQVAGAVAAVELRSPPTQCAFQPLLAKNPPDRCGPGTTQVNIFFADFEDGDEGDDDGDGEGDDDDDGDPLGGWMVSHTAATADFTPRDWVLTSSLPDDRPGSGFFAVDPDTSCFGGDESGVLHLDSPPITLPSGVTAPLLTFDHWVSVERGFDGGNLRVSVNGGPWTLVAPADFTYNPYNATLFTAAQGNSNPLAGQTAFSGSDGGSVLGSWGRSHVNLAPYAGPGDTVRLRLDLGTDFCVGQFGWYVDDVTVYACTANTRPALSLNDVTVIEGDTGLGDAVFTVTLSHAYSRPVSVRYRIRPGTARPGSDYVNDGGGDGRRLVIPPLGISGQIRVRIRGDRRPEPDETFFVELFRPKNATIGDATGQGTILNDDGP